MASYTSTKASKTVKSNAGSETFTFDISSALTSANIPAYATIHAARLTVWGDIDTATSRGKMTATFGSTTICSDVWAGGSAGEVSRTAEIMSHINSENANAGKLINSGTELKIVLDGPVMLSKFNHTASWQLYIQWTEHSCSWNGGTVTKAATCTSDGIKTYTCTVCGKTKTETLYAFLHSFESTIPAKSATCTTAGNSAYKKCSRCGLYFVYNAISDALGGKSDTSSFVIPAKGHTQVTIPAVTPTCENTGLTEGKKCSDCGTIITAQQTVDKLGHNYVGVTTKEPTCTEKGIKTYTCQNDASHKYTEDIPALGHSWGATSYVRAKDYSACTAKRTCSTCGTEETALATMTTEVKTAPTCTTKGVTTHIALFDVPWAVRYAWNVEDIPELGHNYTSVVTEPTSTTNGYTTHTCSRCGDSKVDSYTCKVTVSCDTAMGAVTGGGVYSQNGTATLTATPKTGYKFVKWSDGNTNASRTFTVENSVTYTAIFEKLSPKFTTVEMTYLNKQISASNKVPCREGFIISAKVT